MKEFYKALPIDTIMRPDNETGEMKEFKMNHKEKKAAFITYVRENGLKVIIDC